MKCPTAVRLFFSSKEVDDYNTMVAEACGQKVVNQAGHAVTGHRSRREEEQALEEAEEVGRNESGNLKPAVTFCVKKPYMLL
ncbi:hypothetical protein V5799_007435 [Amblyomma americanum]|uniref:Uncharacterized protein n=1 Tax=Amblyomma americanum TaxID=6943 RepID=A0AAQ4FGF1_AMBAM